MTGVEVRSGEGELLGHLNMTLHPAATIVHLLRGRSIIPQEHAALGLPVMRYLPDCRRAVNAGILTRDELRNVSGFTPWPR